MGTSWGLLRVLRTPWELLRAAWGLVGHSLEVLRAPWELLETPQGSLGAPLGLLGCSLVFLSET